MKQLKKALAILGAVLILGTTAPAHAGNDASWIPTTGDANTPTFHAFAFTDRLPLARAYSTLSVGNGTNDHVCKSTSDSVCAPYENFQYESILKVCENQSETDCVSSVTAYGANDVANAGTFTKYTVTNHMNAFPADAKAGIPAGSMPSIWSIPSAPHASGSDYAVFAGLSGNVMRNGQETPLGGFIQVALVPVVLKDFGKGRQSIAAGWVQSIPNTFYDYCADAPRNGNVFVDCAHVNGDGCIFATNDQGMCYAEEAFGAVQKFNVQLKLAKEPTGWMHGRMIDPTISITKESTGGVKLSVTAGATTVPMVYQNEAWSKLSTEMQNLWIKCTNSLSQCGPFWFARASNSSANWIDLAKTFDGNSQINIIEYVSAAGNLPLEIMSKIAPLIGDKSQASSTTWSMRSLSTTEMNGANKCFMSTPGLKGIVTTNSVAYSAGPPEYKDGSLNYQVSSPHFNPDGTTPFKGNYNLVMRSDVARCIYGFSKAPIKATISVVSSEAANDVATTVANEKDGWLYLSANNFQFSSPTIQVKLSQDAAAPVVTPTPVATPNPKPTVAAKKITITCVKGKTTKSVTAVKPTCPNGYRKK